MSVALGGFLSTWSKARRTFGEGLPRPGVEFDQSAALGRLKVHAESAISDTAWSGTAADAYGGVSAEHAKRIGRIAELDQQLAEQVDRSAQIVSSGRRDLEAVRDLVLVAAGSLPATTSGEQMMRPVVQAGLDRVAEIVATSNGRLNIVGAEIARLASEYRMLGGQV